MKTISMISMMLIAVTFVACKKEKITPVPTTPTENPLEGYTKIKTLSNSTHTIDLYKKGSAFETGYNTIVFQIKTLSGEVVSNAQPTWSPVMHMSSMNHGCPKSSITNPTSSSIYEGYIVFTMASSATDNWTIDIDYTINGTSYTANGTLQVNESSKRRVFSFTGSDLENYIVAMAEPSSPKTGINDLKATIHRMDNMMTFTQVDNFTVKIDPRMPSMGNHGSPNNVNLTQNASDNYYYGKLSLTMSGYWKINLQVLNETGTVLKGEEVSGSTTESSIYFEVEF